MKNTRVHTLTRLALLTAILLIMAYTPLGYLNIGIFLVTFLTIPVIVGALTGGAATGAFLGLIFGLTSFAKTFETLMGGIFLSINPVYTFILCVVPRVLEGLLCGLFFSLLNRNGDDKLWKISLASLSCPLLNTVLYMGALVLLFGNSDYIMQLRGGKNVFAFVASYVGIQALVEAAVCTVAGTVICSALKKAIKIKG